jgi:DNA (cytosine-5)-methyltransferase 1
MKVLSLFSGVGGFDMGLEAAGMETVFQCEWDKRCCNILDRHWPDVPKWDDVSTLTGEYVLSKAPVIDVVAWGSPCQDLSVAGKRAGLQLEGGRSNLFHEGIRIIKEIREASNGKYPRISIWENVYGALNSNRGADFGVILDQMAEAGAVVIEWTVLDAQYWVPQRRKRVFVVAIFDSATAERCPSPLLPVSESVSGDTKKGEQARQAITAGVTAGVGEPFVKVVRSGARLPDGDLPADVWRGEQTAPTLNSFDMGDTRAVVAIVEQPMLIDGRRTDDVRVYSEPVQTLQERIGIGGNNVPMIAIPIQDGREIEKRQNGLGVGGEGDPAYTLDRTGAQSVAIGIQGNMIGRQDHNGPGGKGYSDGGDPMFTLNTIDHHAVATEMRVRRLTPIECERLMGWPDNWTDGQADTHRYRQCGNGVASPVATWIGKHLMKLDTQH